MPTPYKCSRCGLANSMGSTHCQACGTSLSTRAPTPATPTPVKTIVPIAPASVNAPAAQPQSLPIAAALRARFSSLYEVFGWRRLEGQVIHVEPPQMAPREFSWGRFLVKLGLLVVFILLFGKIILAFVVTLFIFLFVVWFLFSFFFPKGAGAPGCLSSLVKEMLGFFLTKRMGGGPKAEEPVRYVRLRDASGQEHSVQIMGDIIAGGINIGDEITAEGLNRGGTLKFSRGWNKRTRSEIRIKRR